MLNKFDKDSLLHMQIPNEEEIQKVLESNFLIQDVYKDIRYSFYKHFSSNSRC